MLTRLRRPHTPAIGDKLTAERAWFDLHFAEDLLSWENPHIDLALIENEREKYKFLEQMKDLLHRVRKNKHGRRGVRLGTYRSWRLTRHAIRSRTENACELQIERMLRRVETHSYFSHLFHGWFDFLLERQL